MTDDDIPVLTQILRTGAGLRIDTAAPPQGDPAFERLDVMPVLDLPTHEPEATGRTGFLRAPDDAPDVGAPERFEPATGEPADGGANRPPYGPTSWLDTGAAAPIDAVEPSRDGDATRAAPAPPVTPHAPEPHDPERAVPPAPSPEDGKALADRVRVSVLEDLGTRIDTEFDARIAQVMHTEIETAVAHLQNALRDHLADALRDVVNRAVEVELVRLRAAPTPGGAAG